MKSFRFGVLGLVIVLVAAAFWFVLGDKNPATDDARTELVPKEVASAETRRPRTVGEKETAEDEANLDAPEDGSPMIRDKRGDMPPRPAKEMGAAKVPPEPLVFPMASSLSIRRATNQVVAGCKKGSEITQGVNLQISLGLQSVDEEISVQEVSAFLTPEGTTPQEKAFIDCITKKTAMMRISALGQSDVEAHTLMLPYTL